jgi:hypothetical protein
MSSSDASSFGTSEIIGIAIGGVFILVTIIGIIISCYAMCGRKNKPPRVGAYPPPNYQQNPYGQQMNTGYYPQQQYGPPQGQYWGPQPPYNAQPQPYYAPKSNY